MRYVLLFIVALITGCGSGSSAPEESAQAPPPLTVKGVGYVALPADPDCRSIRLETYGALGYPDRIDYAQSEMDRLLGVVVNETWWYFSLGFARTFDWRNGHCTIYDYAQAHPRY